MSMAHLGPIVRHPHRRGRPDLPAPRGRDRPERGGDRPAVRQHVAALRPPPDGRREDGQVDGQHRAGRRSCSPTGVSARALRYALIAVHYRASLELLATSRWPPRPPRSSGSMRPSRRWRPTARSAPDDPTLPARPRRRAGRRSGRRWTTTSTSRRRWRRSSTWSASSTGGSRRGSLSTGDAGRRARDAARPRSGARRPADDEAPPLEPEVAALLDARAAARAGARLGGIRTDCATSSPALGVAVEDTRDGQRWRDIARRTVADRPAPRPTIGDRRPEHGRRRPGQRAGPSRPAGPGRPPGRRGRRGGSPGTAIVRLGDRPAGQVRGPGARSSPTTIGPRRPTAPRSDPRRRPADRGPSRRAAAPVRDRPGPATRRRAGSRTDRIGRPRTADRPHGRPRSTAPAPRPRPATDRPRAPRRSATDRVPRPRPGLPRPTAARRAGGHAAAIVRATGPRPRTGRPSAAASTRRIAVRRPPWPGAGPDAGSRPARAARRTAAVPACRRPDAARRRRGARRRPPPGRGGLRRPARRRAACSSSRSGAHALEQLVLHATSLRIPIVEVEGGSLTALAGFDGHQGVALVVEPRRFATLDDILARAAERGEPPFVLVLDSLEDPQNVGTLLRSAEAAGVHGVVFPTRRQAPLTPGRGQGVGRRGRASAALPGRRPRRAPSPTSTATASADRRRRGGRPADRARRRDLRGPLAIVVGSEGQGLGPAVRRRCDLFMRIPMRGAIGSLNAAVAGSVLLFEAVAQRDPSRRPAGRPAGHAVSRTDTEATPTGERIAEPAGAQTAERRRAATPRSRRADAARRSDAATATTAPESREPEAAARPQRQSAPTAEDRRAAEGRRPARRPASLEPRPIAARTQPPPEPERDQPAERSGTVSEPTRSTPTSPSTSAEHPTLDPSRPAGPIIPGADGVICGMTLPVAPT